MTPKLPRRLSIDYKADHKLNKSLLKPKNIIMLKTILTSTLIFTALLSWSQEFAPEGALWHYSFYDINPEVISYATIESKEDTIIDDISCRKMLEVHRFFNDTISTEWHYMYSENDSVFFYAEGDFHLLYDFGAEEGDTIVLDYYLTYDDTPLEMVVDSVEYLDFNGISKKVQHVTCIEAMVIDFGPMIIEGIGRTRSMFPTNDGQTTSMKWRCYEDNQNGLLLNPYDIGSWDGQNCEQVITSIDETETYPETYVRPNPVKDILHIECKEEIQGYSFTDQNGKSVKQGTINEKSAQLDVRLLHPGFYVLKLSTKNRILIKKVIKL